MLGTSGVSFTAVQPTLLQRQDSTLKQGNPTTPVQTSAPETPSPNAAPAPTNQTLPSRVNDPLAASANRGVENSLRTQENQAPSPQETESEQPVSLARSPEEARQQQEQAQIRELSSIDREVRAHEAAHAAAGGSIAGAPSYTYTRGPDGALYATAGEVGIDSSPVANDPAATIEKARTVLQAALAPANPSPQDIRVAAQAQAQLVEAQVELARLEDTSEAEGNDEVAAQSSIAPEEREEEDDNDEPSAIETNRQTVQDRLDRSREQLEAFAQQQQEFNQRFTDIQRQLINTGAVEGRNTQGAFLDLLA